MYPAGHEQTLPIQVPPFSQLGLHWAAERSRAKDGMEAMMEKKIIRVPVIRDSHVLPVNPTAHAHL